MRKFSGKPKRCLGFLPWKQSLSFPGPISWFSEILVFVIFSFREIVIIRIGGQKKGTKGFFLLSLLKDTLD